MNDRGDRVLSNKIFDLVKDSPNALHSTPDQCLSDARHFIDSGKWAGKKMLIINLDDTNGGYTINFSCAGMGMSERVTLLDVLKTQVKAHMGYPAMGCIE